MSRLRRCWLIWGSVFYNDVAPTALGVDLGVGFLQRCRAYGAVGMTYNDVAHWRWGWHRP